MEGAAGFEIFVASPPDREFLVAEIRFEGEVWAEIDQESGAYVVTVYPRLDAPWTFPADDAIVTLARARDALSSYDPKKSPLFENLSPEDRRVLFEDEFD